MEKAVAIEEVLKDRDAWRIIDVRSPSEYLAGHIPGAINIPLFTDDERAVVGTLYKQDSPQIALDKGLEIAGAKMNTLVKSVRACSSPDGKKLLIHCWRGGKRSKAVHWLVTFAGIHASLLTGGYKRFRTAMQQHFNASKCRYNMLGGHTGSGKTEVLQALKEKGQQVVDLEMLANHKGSAFGSIGEPEQPTTEQFENNLFMTLLACDQQRSIWLENESKNIGKVHIPDAFWKIMRSSTLYTLQVDKEVRLNRILKEYSNGVDIAVLKRSFQKIEKRLGGLNLQKAVDALERGDLRQAAGIALDYYDKSYTYQISKWPKEKSVSIPPCNDVKTIAAMLIEAELNPIK